MEGRGDELKEYLLGVSVFDREESYDPRIDPIVRVEAGRLRSKLREYYETDGQGDPVLIDFPKGSYAPALRIRDLPEPSRETASRIQAWFTGKNFLLAALILLCLVSASLVATLTNQNRALQAKLKSALPANLDEEARIVWDRFFVPDVETSVVFGSPMFFSGPEGSQIFLRLGTLNETVGLARDPNFEKLQKRFGPLSGPRYDYALMGDAIAVQRLTAYFGRTNLKLTALPAHLATWDVIRDRNIIILGTPRMLPLLKKLPIHCDFLWDENHNIVNRNPKPREPGIYVTPSHYENVSYALIGRFPGLRANREILSLTAHSAPGVLAAVDFLTRPESLRVMIDKLQLRGSGGARPYEMLLRVFVDSGTPVKTEYITHHIH